jgi:endonuclease/exonuclease/phosphatase family metal-dependent hydrolase
LRIGRTFLVTLTLLFGLHTLRIFLPTTTRYLGQSLSTDQLALYALATFALTLLAPLLRRGLGERGALALAMGGLALARLAMQLATAPRADLALATAGLGLFGWFLALWSQSSHNCSRPGDVPLLAVAFPLAFLLDTGSRSFLHSYDLAWRQGWAATLKVAGLVGLALALLWREQRSFVETPAVREPSWGRALPLVGLGPWLYVAMSITHNPLALTASSGWGDALAHRVVNGLAVVGALLCVGVAGWAALQRLPVALLGGALLTGALAGLVEGVGPGCLWFGVAALSAWAALGQVLTRTALPEPPRAGERFRGWRGSVVVFLALVLLLVTVIMVTEYEVFWMVPVSGVLLALAATWATRVEAGRAPAARRASLGLVGAASPVALVGMGLWSWLFFAPPVVESPPPARPLRVMTYNIHHGLSADNRVDLQAIVDVIAAENPDVIVLNEVNRARATNGFVDTLALVSQRLGMRFVFGANYRDGQYGNALLSRYPILEWDNTHYTRDSTEVRGLLRAVVQVPGGPLTFYATHLDHLSGPEHARAEQVGEALALWAGEPRAVLLGDLNAEPQAPELQPIYEAGFVDALAATGQDDAFTFWDPPQSVHSANPCSHQRRIDYIFLTPDLSPLRAWVVPSRASDHLPVLVEVQVP